MGCISHHIMPLVINSLGGGHTHAYIRTETILRNQARATGRRVPGLKTFKGKIFCGFCIFSALLQKFSHVCFLQYQCIHIIKANNCQFKPSLKLIRIEHGGVSNAVLCVDNTLHKVIASSFGYFSIISVNLWLC